MFKGDPVIDSVLQQLSDNGAISKGTLKNVVEANKLFCDITPDTFEKHMEYILG